MKKPPEANGPAAASATADLVLVPPSPTPTGFAQLTYIQLEALFDENENNATSESFLSLKS